VLIGDDVKRNAFAGLGDGWASFYANYPGAQGITWLSRVGFNRARDQALVYPANRRHTLMGFGEFLLLGYENSVWRLQGFVQSWIS